MKLKPSLWNPAKTVMDIPSAGWFANFSFGIGALITAGVGAWLVAAIIEERPAVAAWLPLFGIACLLLYICRRVAELSAYLKLMGTLIVCVGRRQSLEGLFSEDEIDALRGKLGLDVRPQAGQE